MTEILILDENPALRQLLREILEAAPELEGQAQCFEASCTKEALRSLDRHHPDWVLIDAGTISEDGLHATQTVHDRWPSVPIVVISNSVDPILRDAALQAGARHCWSKERLNDLPNWIRQQNAVRPPARVIQSTAAIQQTSPEPPVSASKSQRGPKRFRQWLARLLREAAAQADKNPSQTSTQQNECSK